MKLNDIIDRIKLPFRKEKELFSSLYGILGFYPRNIEYYKQALMHKSIRKRNDKGKPLNNERLEFLGDAILDAAVGYIVYRHYEGKREGFLTNTRSKLVSRDTLGKLAVEMGLGNLLLSASHSTSHNSYVEGNAFEALVGAIYLDRGYEACLAFFEKQILGKYIDIDKVAFKAVNFKSKLLEWSQKNRVRMEFKMLKQKTDENGSPIFSFQVMLEGVEGEKGSGYSKKEAQQQASKDTLQRLKRELIPSRRRTLSLSRMIRGRRNEKGGTRILLPQTNLAPPHPRTPAPPKTRTTTSTSPISPSSPRRRPARISSLRPKLPLLLKPKAKSSRNL